MKNTDLPSPVDSMGWISGSFSTNESKAIEQYFNGNFKACLETLHAIFRDVRSNRTILRHLAIYFAYNSANVKRYDDSVGFFKLLFELVPLSEHSACDTIFPGGKTITNPRLDCAHSAMYSRQYNDAIHYLNQEILNNHRSDQDQFAAFKKLALCHYLNGDSDKAYRTQVKAYNFRPNLYKFSGKNFSEIKPISYSTVETQLLDFKFRAKELDFIFHESHANEENLNNSWKNLQYLHVPKCSGGSFERPINEMVVRLHRKANADDPIAKLINPQQHLSTEGLTHPHEIRAFQAEINSLNINDINSVFYTMHEGSWKSTYELVSSLIRSKPKIVMTYRDPVERLFSNVRFNALGRIEGPYETKQDLIENISTEPHNFINCYYKYMNDIGLIGSDELSTPSSSSLDLIDEMYVIDLKNDSLISKVKSLFLSSAGLPNILQSRVIHPFDPDTLKIPWSDIHDVHNHLIANGSVEKDLSIDFASLIKKSSQRIESDFTELIVNSNLHPITFIFTSDHRCIFTDTKSLIEDKNILPELIANLDPLCAN